MRDDKRACFALISATIHNKRLYNSIYDFSLGKFVSVSASGIDSAYLSFFDYNRGGYVSGSPTSLYDYPTSSYVSLTISGNEITCYDFETGFYVSFTINGYSVTAFDYQTSSLYNYSLT